MLTTRAVGYSFGLHFVLAALLAFARAGIPVSPNVVMVDWVEMTPSLGEDARTASPNVGEASKPVVKKSLSAPAAREAGLAPAEASAPVAGTFSPEVEAKRMSLEQFYRASVRQTLERAKVYPPLAKRLGQTGTVVLKFVVGKDGSIVSSELVSTSPFPVLNEAAKNLIASAKFQPVPNELAQAQWEFEIPVEYRLN